jgi:hypothetical protein
MSDEPSDNDHAWWKPPDRPDLAEPEDLIQLGPMYSARPVGPISLRSSSRRPYILAGVAVAALLGGAGAALAATNSPAPTPAPLSAVVATPSPAPGQAGQAGQPGAAGPRYRRFGMRLGLGGGPFGLLHGQFVVPKPGGGYQTVDVQNGQVTAVSNTSITLKSQDGFTMSYVVASSTLVDAQRDGIGSVKVGNQATVLATVSGSTATAARITDRTLVQQTWPGPGYRPGGSSGSSAGQPG